MAATLTTDTLIQYNGRYYTGYDIEAMREWIDQCQWGDIESADDLSDFEVLRGVDDNVDGGLTEFMANMI